MVHKSIEILISLQIFQSKEDMSCSLLFDDEINIEENVAFHVLQNVFPYRWRDLEKLYCLRSCCGQRSHGILGISEKWNTLYGRFEKNFTLRRKDVITSKCPISPWGQISSDECSSPHALPAPRVARSLRAAPVPRRRGAGRSRLCRNPRQTLEDGVSCLLIRKCGSSL